MRGDAYDRNLEYLTAAVLALTVFAFALGSSSVPALASDGKKLRWGMLFLLAGLALESARRAYRERARQLDVRFLSIPAALLALSALSAAWSIDPRLTLGRTFSVAVAVVACGALAYATGGRLQRVLTLGIALVAGAVLVALAGLVVLFVHRSYAIMPAVLPAFRGLGENANTVSLLAATVLPVALLLAVSSRGRLPQALGALSSLVLAGTIVASASRGALIAGFVGVTVFVACASRRLLWQASLIGAAAVFFAAGTVGSTVIAQRLSQPEAAPAGTTPPPATTPPPTAPGLPGGSTPVAPPASTVWAAPVFSLTSSGRAEAWAGTIERANRRPVAGYGFGTEDVAFIDRFHEFVGGRAENSYIGMYLQLGVVGLALLLAFGLVVLRRARRARRSLPAAGQDVAAAFIGVFVGGVTVAAVQSYVYSAGNVAMLALLASSFLIGALAAGVEHPVASRSPLEPGTRAP